MTTTVRMKASQISKDWHVLDAAGVPLGRLASEAAKLLRGKHKPTYEPHFDDGDFVIVVNAAQVKVTGRKAEQKKYHRHSGYPGGLKTRSFEVQFARFPDRVIEQAVWGMLPGGSLGEAMLKHLKVYRGPKHPHESQVTGSLRAREAREVAFAETMLESRKPPRLRPLSIPDAVVLAAVMEAPVVVPEPEPELAPAPAKRSRKKAEPEAVVEAVAAVEASVEPAPAEETPATEAAAEPAAEATEPPKRTRRRAPKATEE